MAAKHAFVNVTRARVKIEKFMHGNEISSQVKLLLYLNEGNSLFTIKQQKPTQSRSR